MFFGRLLALGVLCWPSVFALWARGVSLVHLARWDGSRCR
jgi:hypothetical protein